MCPTKATTLLQGTPVFSKAPFAGPRKLLDYLGRCTHRVAISNHRLLSCDDGQVRFTYPPLRLPGQSSEEDLPGSMPRTTGGDGAGTCRGENGCRLDPRPDRHRHHPLPPLWRTAGARGTFASAIAVPLSFAGPQLLGHLMTSIHHHAVSPDQPCSAARSRVVCADRDQNANGGGDSPFFGRQLPQSSPGNRLPVHGVLCPDDDRSDTIPK